jgi:hypothetical protein
MKLRFNFTYALFAVIFLILEILIALYFESGFIRYTLGDSLVVMLLYCCFRSVLDISPFKTAITALGIAFAIEFGQYVHVLHILNLQDTPWALLLLGSHFSVSDLMAYTLGMIIFLTIDIRRITYETT